MQSRQNRLQELAQQLAALPEGDEKRELRRQLAELLVDVAVTAVAQGVWQRDLRGVNCPLVWAKARMTLEKIPAAERLILQIDLGDPIENVPRALITEGFQIVERNRLSDGNWELLIQKPPFSSTEIHQ